MASNGFFLGGMAEGIQSSNKQALADRTLEQDTALRTRGLDIQETNAKRTADQQLMERAEKELLDLTGTIAETIKAASAGGSSPQIIQQKIAPLVEIAKRRSARIGKDPAALDAKVGAWLTQPNAIDAATMEGKAAAAKQISMDKALTAAEGGEAGVNSSERIRDPVKKVEAENKLRDDFTSASKLFITQRDYASTMQQLQAIGADNMNGADDIALVFAFMKILDPNSAVLPGEAANANNAGGVPEAIRGQYNNLIGGGKLSTTSRENLLNRGLKRYEQAVSDHEQIRTQYGGIAKRKGLNTENVIIDYRSASVPGAPASFSDRFMGTTPGGLKYTVTRQ